MATWPDRFEGLLDLEIADYKERGLEFELDQALLDSGGPVVFRGSIEHEGETIDLEVWYPDSFPYLRPDVIAPRLRLPRHQNPVQHNLCLLDRSTSQWDVDLTGAWLVAERVPYLLRLLAGDPDVMLQEEAPQGEPASVFFGYTQQTLFLVPNDFLAVPPELKKGRGRIAFEPSSSPSPLIRGAVIQLSGTRRARRNRRRGQPKNGDRVVVRLAEPALATRYKDAEVIPFSWIRLDSLPTTYEADALFDELAAQAPAIEEQHWQKLSTPSGEVEVAVVAAVFPEEVQQDTYEDGWLFVVRLRGAQAGDYVTPGVRYSPVDLAARIPRIANVSKARVALAGLGGLGGPFAFDLARSQVGELRVLDHDHVEPGTAVRWPVGLAAAGFPKLSVIAGTIARDYPFTTVVPFPLQIGGSSAGTQRPAEPEMVTLERFITGSDLLIDATAELGIQHLLSDIASKLGVPQLYVWGTEGGVGGVVARVLPGRLGCWICLQHHINDETINPPADPTGTTQPRGCATRTFTGTSFDLMPIVAQAMRAATNILEGRVDDGCDVAVLAFKDENGHTLPVPRWTALELTPHPECPVCGGAAR